MCLLRAVHRIYAPLSKTHTHIRAQCAHKTHMWPSNNNKTVPSKGLNSLPSVCVCMYHVSNISIYTRISWHERHTTILLINGATAPSAWEEIIWLVNARSAHAHTNTSIFSHSVATISLSSVAHWHLINILTQRHTHTCIVVIHGISHRWGKAIMVRFIIIINTTWLLNLTREWKTERKEEKNGNNNGQHQPKQPQRTHRGRGHVRKINPHSADNERKTNRIEFK